MASTHLQPRRKPEAIPDLPVTPTRAGRPGTGSPDDAPSPAGLRVGLVAALMVTIPLATGRVLWSSPGGGADWNRRVNVAPFDLVLLAIIVVVGRDLVHDLVAARAAGAPRSFRRLSALGLASAALGIVLLVALVVHPSPLGFMLAFHVVGGLAVFRAIEPAREDAGLRHALLLTVVAVGVLQAALSVAQSVHGIAFGISPLDFAGRLYPFGSSRAGRGGLDHPYHLACLLIVAQGAALLGLRTAGRRARVLWLAALVMIGIGLASTFSRSAVLGEAMLVLVAVVGALARPKANRLLAVGAVAIVLGLGVGVLSLGTGWSAKSSQTADAQQVDTGRRVRLQEATRLIKAYPVLGVGPGRYVVALQTVPHQELLPAHNMVFQEAAEGGVLAGLLTIVVLGLFGWRCLRRGAWTLCLFLPMTPFLLLDAYPYVFGTGLALSAIWIGLMQLDPAPEPDGARS